jgi:hypothetical protein
MNKSQCDNNSVAFLCNDFAKKRKKEERAGRKNEKNVDFYLFSLVVFLPCVCQPKALLSLAVGGDGAL